MVEAARQESQLGKGGPRERNAYVTGRDSSLPLDCLQESYKRKKKGHWVKFETDTMQGKMAISKAWGT